MTIVPEQSRQIRGRPAGKGDHAVLEFIDQTGPDTLSRFGEEVQTAEMEGDPCEFHELRVFHSFLKDHVQLNSTRSVQCMLLWSEWVRDFRRRTSGFPNLVREKEFSMVIMDTFGVAIADNDSRGKIYPGITYVP